ncbi:CHAD domain-containing protein [Kitasatospora sp. NA04385]|uniref:CHAD domain-containing protein n=1 Tax=Kitasatospora sp. NA04385 TaxID=2742135 RepID=UPI0015919DBF|nr:CHAD domain-containing protein [Kitasatospora sp. NA04385]QKW23727.1 CHAD domain-containing protein [Kitasatospora sp. NA04385]
MAHRTDGSAGDAIAARLRTQTAELAALEPDVRADRPDAVHRMRVAARRLRSALRTHRRHLRGDHTATENELRRLGRALGPARDTEVLGARLLAQARELPPGTDRERVRAELAAWHARETRDARTRVLAALDDRRFRRLLATLTALAADPPLNSRAARPYGPELTRTLRREHRRTAERLAVARSTPDGPARERALHDARKAAKRARYAGEAAGRPARSFTRRMKALQNVLGRHQDAVVARDTLRTLSDGGFGYGVLYGRQTAELGFARELLPQVWEQAARRPKKLR